VLEEPSLVEPPLEQLSSARAPVEPAPEPQSEPQQSPVAQLPIEPAPEPQSAPEQAPVEPAPEPQSAPEQAPVEPAPEPPSAPEQAPVAQLPIEPESAALVESPAAAALAHVSSPEAAAPAELSPPPPLVVSSSPPAPLSAGVSLLPPAWGSTLTLLRARLAAAQARLVSSVPPRWLELARQRPVLWMVVAPAVVASLLILVALVREPPAKAARPEPAASATVAFAASAIATPTIAGPEKPEGAALAELEGKPSASLSAEQLLLLNAGHAKRKRSDVQALSRKLQQQPELAKDASVQAELLRWVADPDTADAALAAMTEAHSPIGADLLYEVWTSRSLPPATAELARSLLYSRDVRPSASPALAVALELRSADSCEALEVALPKALSDGDRRALAPLAKLNSRRSCGAKQTPDCYSCVRSQMKQVNAAIGAIKRRAAR